MYFFHLEAINGHNHERTLMFTIVFKWKNLDNTTGDLISMTSYSIGPLIDCCVELQRQNALWMKSVVKVAV